MFAGTAGVKRKEDVDEERRRRRLSMQCNDDDEEGLWIDVGMTCVQTRV